MPEYEMPIEEQLKILVKKFASLETTLDERFDRVDKRFDQVDGRLDKVDARLTRIEIRLDETLAIAKMGLEAIDATRESMNQRFAAVDKKQKEEIDLLKTVIVHVRKRVEVVERRRRS